LGGGFAGIDYDGSQLSVTYGQAQTLWVRKYDLDLNNVGSPQLLTTSSDPLPGDHKLILVGQRHYVCYAANGDKDLHLMSFDLNWSRIGFATVVSNSANSNTNDMYLVSNGARIFIGRFAPADLTGLGSTGHFISRRNPDLTSAGSDITALTPNHVNGASAIWNGTNFVTFASNGAGGPHDLLRIEYDASFGLLGSGTLQATSENEFFPTGAAYDAAHQRTYVAYVRSAPGSFGIQASGDILLKVFDSSWREIGSTTVATGSYNRPHLALVGSNLYCTYDTPLSPVTRIG
jgi:hypothetical protein